MKCCTFKKLQRNASIKNIAARHPCLAWFLLFIGAPLFLLTLVGLCACIAGLPILLLSSL